MPCCWFIYLLLRLRHSHKDELDELEERFEAERERLEQRCAQEIELYKENLQRSYRNNDNNKLSEQIARELQIPTNSKSYDTIKMKNERECETGDLTIDSSEGNTSHKETNYLRSQYESELKNETDQLMRRLLEISDELDNLRSNA